MLTLCHTRTYPLGPHEILSKVVEKGKAVPILMVIKGVDTAMKEYGKQQQQAEETDSGAARCRYIYRG